MKERNLNENNQIPLYLARYKDMQEMEQLLASKAQE